VKVVHGTTVYIKDVANVRDGYSPQTNMVHVSGRSPCSCRSSSRERQHARRREADPRDPPGHHVAASEELKVSLLFDQSIFVRAAVQAS